MELEKRIPTEAERREEEEAYARQMERARNVANNWPEWKRNSGLRWWPNGAAPPESDAAEGEGVDNGAGNGADNGQVEHEHTE